MLFSPDDYGANNQPVPNIWMGSSGLFLWASLIVGSQIRHQGISQNADASGIGTTQLNWLVDGACNARHRNVVICNQTLANNSHAAVPDHDAMGSRATVDCVLVNLEVRTRAGFNLRSPGSDVF